MQQFQSQRCKGMRRQIIFEIQDADEVRLADDWQTDDGFGLMLEDVGVRGKQLLSHGIVDDQAFARALDVIDDRQRRVVAGLQGQGCVMRWRPGVRRAAAPQ